MDWLMKEISQEKLKSVASNIDSDLIKERLSYNLGYSKDQIDEYLDNEVIQNLIATILINRELDNQLDIINAPHKYFINPINLTNAKEASEIIHKYCNDKNSIIYVYADYDVDGITAGYTMTDALREVSKGLVIVKYPDRNEGYGLSMDYCDTIISDIENEQSTNFNKNVLVVTVDNGITKVDEINYLKANGIEVIVTDHHKSKEVVPNCLIVNPHNYTIEQEYGKHLCGCGVAFKVAQLVQESFGINNMSKYLPHLALSTIADVMPMHTENLAFIQYGLDIINSDRCPKGIKELKKLESIDYVNTTTIGWVIGPMLNACGRMGDTELGSKMFFTSDEPMQFIVAKIKALNDNRKEITKKAIKDLKKIEQNDDKIFLLNTNNYGGGVLGIIAGKAVEIFNKPSFIITEHHEDNNLLHGSARSIPGFDLTPLLIQLKNEGLIRDFGGHSEAAGLSLYKENINNVIARCNELIKYKEVDIIDESPNDTLEIDEIITLDNVNEVILALSTILPTDNRNIKNTIFALLNIKIDSFKEFKSGYTELKLRQGNIVMEASIYGELAEKFLNEILPSLDPDTGLINIAGYIDKKSFYSSRFQKKTYSISIQDIKIA